MELHLMSGTDLCARRKTVLFIPHILEWNSECISRDVATRRCVRFYHAKMPAVHRSAVSFNWRQRAKQTAPTAIQFNNMSMARAFARTRHTRSIAAIKGYAVRGSAPSSQGDLSLCEQSQISAHMKKKNKQTKNNVNCRSLISWFFDSDGETKSDDFHLQK